MCLGREHGYCSVQNWARRKLRSVPTFTTGFTSLEMKRRQSDNRKKCFRYAARLVWGFLGKNCRREHNGCVVIGVRYMFPDPEGDYNMGYKGSQATIIYIYSNRNGY